MTHFPPVAGFSVACLLTLLGTQRLWAGEAADWKVVKGRHFLVHYRSDSVFAEKIAARAEDHYRRIAADLGFTKYGDFWLWEKRVKIYVYPDQKSFMSTAGAPAWAAGKATYLTREITTFQGSGEFLESTLPHELSHLILRDFVGFTGNVPLWLDEGVAQWEEEGERTRAMRRAGRLAGSGRLTPLARLMGTSDVRTLENAAAIADFYAQSVSLVGFLKSHGSDAFRKLCGHLRDGKELDAALRFTYPSRLRNITELEVAWKKSLALPGDGGR